MDRPLPAPPRPLVLTADADLLEEVLRVAATAGVEVSVAADVVAARPAWAAAPLVLVGADAAEPCARARLPRRGGVLLVGTDLDDASVWERAVALGAERVAHLPGAEALVAARLADAAEGSGEGVVVVVAGGRGGAGATSLACALAATAARAGQVAVLVDADPLGGGLDLVFGGEHAPGLRWPDLAATRGRLPASPLVQALPVLPVARAAVLRVLSFDRAGPVDLAPEALGSVLAAARRGADLVVVDLPRRVGATERVALEASRAALLVVPAEVRAAAAAARVAAALGTACADLRLVVRGPAPSGLAAQEVARALGLPLAGDLRPEPGLDRALDRGEAPGARGPLAELCAGLLAELVPATVARAA